MTPPSNKKKPDDLTLQQLESLGYTQDRSHTRPLLVCDVDEVVLHLVDPFVKVIEERGFNLKSHSFKLTGNVFDAETGREATQEEVWDGLTQLFEEQADRQGIVDGVVEGLNTVAEKVDIIFLTNMPHEFAQTRRDHLISHGLHFPLVTNTRSKVPAIEIIKAHCQHTVGFIDDTPINLTQVGEALPDVDLFHFMANEQFRELAGEIDNVHFSLGDWAIAGHKIVDILHGSTDT